MNDSPYICDRAAPDLNSDDFCHAHPNMGTMTLKFTGMKKPFTR